MDQIDQNGYKPTNYFFQSSVAELAYAGEVGKSITVVLHITSVYCVPNIIEITKMCRPTFFIFGV